MSIPGGTCVDATKAKALHDKGAISVAYKETYKKVSNVVIRVREGDGSLGQSKCGGRQRVAIGVGFRV